MYRENKQYFKFRYMRQWLYGDSLSRFFVLEKTKKNIGILPK